MDSLSFLHVSNRSIFPIGGPYGREWEDGVVVKGLQEITSFNK